jgi:hypothetical protein
MVEAVGDWLKVGRVISGGVSEEPASDTVSVSARVLRPNARRAYGVVVKSRISTQAGSPVRRMVKDV